MCPSTINLPSTQKSTRNQPEINQRNQSEINQKINILPSKNHTNFQEKNNPRPKPLSTINQTPTRNLPEINPKNQSEILHFTSVVFADFQKKIRKIHSFAPLWI